MRNIMIGCLGRIRTVNITNMVTNGNFANTSGWNSTGVQFTVASNVATFRGDSAQDTLSQVQSFVSGHKYYLCANIKTGAAATQLRINDGVNVAATDIAVTGDFVFSSIFFPSGNTSASGAIYLIDFRSSGWTNIEMKYVSLIDLTAAFGSGNEPAQADIDVVMSGYANKWLNGTQPATIYY